MTAKYRRCHENKARIVEGLTGGAVKRRADTLETMHGVLTRQADAEGGNAWGIPRMKTGHLLDALAEATAGT